MTDLTRQAFTTDYPEDHGFSWLDDNLYIWAPLPLVDEGGVQDRDFLEVASGWHGGMDAVYSLHSYWYGHRFYLDGEGLEDLARFRKTAKEARGMFERYYDAAVLEGDEEKQDELGYLLETLDDALSGINPSIGASLDESRSFRKPAYYRTTGVNPSRGKRQTSRRLRSTDKQQMHDITREVAALSDDELLDEVDAYLDDPQFRTRGRAGTRSPDHGWIDFGDGRVLAQDLEEWPEEYRHKLTRK